MPTQTPFFARVSRRTALSAVALTAGSIGLRRSASTQESSFSSGALGITRADIEARWGAGERVKVSGHPIYNETYAYPGQGWTTYVWYMSFNDVEVAAYVEVDYGPDGVTMVQARELVSNYLPADAEFSELFVAPATPGGPTALTMTRYLSPSLASRYDGIIPAEILVTLHESWPDSGEPERATAISLMVRMVTQQG
jgi:hypothetical protein